MNLPNQNIIIDTDIGSDIDDLWALIYILLKCPDRIRLIQISHRNTDEKALIVAKLLEIIRLYKIIPIAIGKCQTSKPTALSKVVSDFSPQDYQGTLIKDDHPTKALENCLITYPDSLIIGLSPACSLGSISHRNPDILRDATLVQMAGSLDYGYNNQRGAIPEWNIKEDIQGFSFTLNAPWKGICLVPLDSCGDYRIKGNDFERIARHSSKISNFLMQCYEAWESDFNDHNLGRSSILFNLLTAYIALNPNNSMFTANQLSLGESEELFKDPEHGRELFIAHARQTQDCTDEFLALITQ